MSGYNQTIEHRKKIGEANKRGKFVKCIACKNDFWIQPSEEKRKAGSKKCCCRECFKIYYKNNFAKFGKDNMFWRGGSFSYLKRVVLKRDNFTCQICGLREPEIMEVDHIKERSKSPELSNLLSNLQTLCPNCHAIKTNKFLRKSFEQRVM